MLSSQRRVVCRSDVPQIKLPAPSRFLAKPEPCIPRESADQSMRTEGASAGAPNASESKLVQLRPSVVQALCDPAVSLAFQDPHYLGLALSVATVGRTSISRSCGQPLTVDVYFWLQTSISRQT